MCDVLRGSSSSSIGQLTRRDGEVRAGPELLRVSHFVAAHVAVELDPVLLVGCTRAGPRRWVELFVAFVLARVTGVCWVFVSQHVSEDGEEDADK